MEGLLFLAVVLGAVFMFGFAIPYLLVEGVPEWLKPRRSKAHLRQKHRRELLEYIEWKRAKDMGEMPPTFPTESEWNKKKLAGWVRSYNDYPGMYRREMLDQKGKTELMQWVLKNDPSVLQSRIQELEKELEIKSE